MAEEYYRAAREGTTVLNTDKKTEDTLALFRKDLDALAVHQHEEQKAIVAWKMLLTEEEQEEADDEETEDSHLPDEKELENLEAEVEATADKFDLLLLKHTALQQKHRDLKARMRDLGEEVSDDE